MTSHKKKLLDHLQNEVFCRLGSSKTHGVGVFAIRAIKKDINPLVSWLDGREIKFTKAELKHLPLAVRKQIERFCFYDTKKTLIPRIGMNAMSMAIYLNHSKKPNLRLTKVGQFQALRTIKKNEELLIDYDDTFGEKHYF
jgi:SET domain-containing protein